MRVGAFWRASVTALGYSRRALLVPANPERLKTDPQQTGAEPGGEFLARQESRRRGLKRANTAVAVVIITVLALALTALWQGRRATGLQATAEQSRQRAELAEARARQDLWRALLAEASATRLGQTVSRREVGLETIQRAASIAYSDELRDEAIATLALPDFRLESTVPIDGSMRIPAFDDTLRLCAVGLTNGDVLVRRASDAMEVRRFTRAAAGVPEAQEHPVNLEFASGGGALSVRYYRGAIAVFDLQSGAVRFTRDTDALRRPAARAHFSSDGRFIVAPVFKPDGFEVMDARTGKTVAHFPQISSFSHAAVRPGTNQFASYANGMVSVYDWDKGEKVADYPFAPGSRVLAWSADGIRLAVGGNSSRVHVWDVATRRLTELPGHQADVFDLQFEGSGARLAVATLDNTTRIWDLADERLVAIAEDRRLARWGPDGRSGWVLSKQRFEIRNETGNPILASPRGRPDDTDGATMDVSPDGRWAVSKAGANAALVWNLTEPRAPQRVALTNLHSFCFHPKEPKLLLMRDHRVEEQTFSVQTNDGRSLATLGTAVPRSIVEGRLPELITTSANGRTRVYVELRRGAIWLENGDSTNGLIQLEKIYHSSVLRRSGSIHGTGTVALSPDGHWLVVSADGTQGAYLFDARTGQAVRPIDEYTGGVQFSLDGRWLVLMAVPYCRVFRTSDWSPVWSKPTDPRSPSYSGAAAFSPDGSRLACVLSAHRATLVSTEDGREEAVLEPPDASTITLARWTPDGERLVLATRDNQLNIWLPQSLRHELTKLGLERKPSHQVALESAPALSTVSRPTLRWIVPTLLACAAIAAGLALIALRHHRRLIGEFSQTEALALRREKELQIERELNELKNRFVSMVSHEFRTPLGITMSAIELLRNHLELLEDAKRKELFDDIFVATRHMADMMEQMLVLSRAEAGKLAFRPVPINLENLCHRLVDESLSASNRRCPIEVKVEGTLTGAEADESLLRHIFSNLLSNAVKYSAAGQTVEFGVTRTGGNAVFTVRDAGIGIPPGDVPRLFHAFHRAANVGETPGTGLGLVIVKRCVDLYGGAIEVRSKPGEGTTFTVTLPVFVAS